MSVGELSRVVLAISSYRSDEAVLALLHTAVALRPGFGAIVVVDSDSTGSLENAIRGRGWSDLVTCVSATSNIGSAGNLAQRLVLAARGPHDWVYAINHDGDLKPDTVTALVAIADHEHSAERPIGAVYPLRRLPNRDGMYDVTGRVKWPVKAIRTKQRPTAPMLDVYWSSSNGALYSLEAVRRGLLPWADLWLGYEDLGYGLLLHERGYRQILAATVVVDDDYEFQRTAGLWITRKPSWYAYYRARNMLLVAARTRQPLTTRFAIAGRLLVEMVLTVAVRDHKLERLRYIGRGTLDGLRGQSGKFIVP